jgi:hypothetical protein
MLVVRKEQVAVFRAEAQRRFAERMRAHIAEEYPAHHAALGDEGTRQLIQKGIAAAERHGIDAEATGGPTGATAGLIELMVEFGERLERSPERPWAEKMLAHLDVPGSVRVTAVRERFAAATGGRRLVVAAT